MQTADASGARPPLHERWLPAFIHDENQPWWSYAAKGWLLTLLPSLALSALVGLMVGSDTEALPAFDATSGWLLFVALVLFAPITETIAMTGPVLLLNRLVGPQTAVIGNALLWGGLHSLAAPAWGLITWWPFLVFSAILLFWRSRGRLIYGMVLVTIIHAMQNSVGFAAMTLS